jgi:hypothetical protein
MKLAGLTYQTEVVIGVVLNFSEAAMRFVPGGLGYLQSTRYVVH